MKFEVYMERVMSTVVEVEAESWQDAFRLANEEGVPSHEDGDIARDWESLIVTDENGRDWEAK